MEAIAYTAVPLGRFDDLLPVYSPEELAAEMWRTPVADSLAYPRYEVSNLGRLRVRATGRLLKPMWVHNSVGGVYWRAGLSCDGRGYRRFMLHRIVAETFVDGRSARRDFVHHRDHCTTNPRASNLQWCSQSFNMQEWYMTRREVERFGPVDYPDSANAGYDELPAIRYENAPF